ncbi:hypothetical protein E1162_02780 [Rhodobacteraceae bacterium RKSG542]|uniref:hypothetical protein n=1 Tax=Pseudovibrio flavus TaxID=2529854 RepID=UPI0012BD7415|nr:hypothetical protein [Pseudovibrio flavus]MTI16159.1 hypothetical protein [Pseudovibrio flavus]
MPSAVSRLPAALFFAAGLTNPAHSAEFFSQLELGAAVLVGEESQFFAERGESTPFKRIRDLNVDNGVSGGFALSGVYGAMLRPMEHANGGISLSVQGRFTATQSNSDDAFLDSGPGERYGWAGLDNGGGWGTSDGHTLFTDVERDFFYSGAAILLSIHQVVGTESSFVFGVGPSARRLSEERNHHGLISSTAVTQVMQSDELRTDYWGGIVSAQFQRALRPDLSASLKGEFGVFQSATKFTADQNIWTNSGPESEISASLKTNKAAMSASLKAALDYQYTDAINLGGFGEVSYLSHAPQVDYGSVPTDAAGGKLRLVDGDLLGFTVGVRATMTF